jgi:hypothetical protein
MKNKSHEAEQPISSQSNLESARQIDIAMADDRLAKVTIRGLWLERAIAFNEQYPEDDVPLYLTLSGAEARDIRLLAEHNVISLTENGGIAQESQHRVIAIESNSQAVLTLQKQFIGLQIIKQDVRSLVRGDSLTKFPDGKQERMCCAKIVNLDLQSELRSISQNGDIVFPLFIWVEKISRLHVTNKPAENWCLCLTLNATLSQPDVIGGFIQAFLKENYASSPDFEVSCRNLLGDEIQDAILSEDLLNLSAFSMEENQKILMIFVPKKISSIVHNQNWHIRTLWNLCYGGNDGHAPMVSWILSFEWDERAAATPQTVYRESLTQILASARRIEDNGAISEFN